MQMTLRTQALAALTALCVIGVGAAAVILFPRGPVYGPADLLPAESTLIFIQNVQPDIKITLGSIIPSLQTLPSYSGSTAALMRLPDGSTDWIVFEQMQNQTEPTIRAENPASFDLIRTGSPLGEEENFRTLMRSISGKSMLYVNAHKLQTSLPASVRKATGPMAIALSPQELGLARFTETRVGGNVSNGIRPFFVNPILTVQAADMRMFLSSLSEELAGDRSIAYEGRIKAWFAETFGTDLSLQYDFLPLLNDQSTFALGKITASGGLVAVLEGTGGGDLQKKLEAMHQGFGGRVAGIARLQRTFDDKFTYDNVRVDGSSVSITQEDVGGWSLMLNSNGTKTFATATNGRRFILSNSEAALRSAIGAYPPPVEGPSPIAQGSINPTALKTLLQSWIGEDPLVQLPGLKKADLHWQVLRSGNVTLLRLF